MVRAIERALPELQLLYVSDSEHVPYGDKPPAEVLGYVIPLLEGLVSQGCEVIVIACNTVTTHHIQSLRKQIGVPLVGIEPMVKPAARLTKTGIIAVCATPSTLASERYAWLKRTYAAGVEVIEPDCSRWAYMIEHDRSNELQLKGLMDGLFERRADVVVLGCTHYHWIEDQINHAAEGRAIVIQPEQAVIKQLQRTLREFGRLA